MPLFEALRQQDHLYSVLEKGADGHQAIVVGAVHESLHRKLEGIAAVLEKLAEPQVAIVSMTITEKGYCIEPGSGRLDRQHSGSSPIWRGRISRRPCPAFWWKRCGCGANAACPPSPCSPVTIFRRTATCCAGRCSIWRRRGIRRSPTGSPPPPPSRTMVDRIVPAATPATLDEIAAALGGVRDECAIACEPFIQWVVEDNFTAGRPAWEQAGVQLVSDVLPFEHMKLRMLNGSHSFLAYLGYLGGYRYINECMADEHYRRAALRLMLDEQAPTLSVTGISLADYAAQLIARFSNPALQHLTWQIAMDGSQKLPQRLLDAVRWHLRHGGDYSGLALGVAGWMRYVGGVDDAGQPIDIRDPLADVLQQTIAATPDDRRRVTALLALKSVFSETLAACGVYRSGNASYLSLRDRGARETVKEWVMR